MDLQLVQEIQSYNHHGQERRTGVQLLKEIDVINSDFNNWLNGRTGFFLYKSILAHYTIYLNCCVNYFFSCAKTERKSSA